MPIRGLIRLRLITLASAAVVMLTGALAAARAETVVGAWAGQYNDANGTAIRIEYGFMPNGTYQKTFAMQVGLSGGYDWVAGIWFMDGAWLRLEVKQHYSSSSGDSGPLPGGELWQVRMPNPNTLVLTHALCVQHNLTRPDCVLPLMRTQ